MKICITCSPGGHLIEAIQLLPILKGHEVFFYTYSEKHIKKKLCNKKTYIIKKPLNILRNFWNSLKIFIKEKPDIVISTGANVTVPISIIAKFFGKKLIFIECSAQVFTPSLTGRILYPFADLFIVQWKPLLKKYGKKAIYGGLLI
ncbi:MAG: PssD/Cps14F family polysaccharide biosynthesis glycosyltransferase [Candidatus Pacearchaeota archaeon]